LAIHYFLPDTNTEKNTDKDGNVAIDGFKMTDQSSGPFDWKYTTPLRDKYQHRIAQCHLETELFEVLYSIIVLAVMDR